MSRLFDHSAGGSPVAGSMTFADTYLKSASGMSVFAEVCLALVEVVVPEAVEIDAHQVHDARSSACRRRSALIGGVAPTESPAATVIVRHGSSAWNVSNHGFRKAEPPIVKPGLAAPPRREVVRGVLKRNELTVEVADVEDLEGLEPGLRR